MNGTSTSAVITTNNELILPGERQTDGYCQDCQAMSAWRNVLFHNFLVTVTATLRVSLDTTGPIVKLSLTYINPFCGSVK